jgi:hypothetical protein
MTMKIEMMYLRLVTWPCTNHVPEIREIQIQNQTGRDLAKLTARSRGAFFAAPVQVTIGTMAAGEAKVLDNIRLNLQPNFFAQMTESVAGDIDVTVTADNEPPYKQEFPVEVLAYDQWCGNDILPEMLSAFVTRTSQPSRPFCGSLQNGWSNGRGAQRWTSTNPAM